MHIKTRKLTTCAVMIALSVVLTIFTIRVGDIFEISVVPAVVMFTGVYLGPWYGAACGIAADFLGTLALGTGYNPIFAVTWFFYGIIPALLIKSLPATFKRSLGTVCLTQGICSLCLNTLWIYIFYGAGLSTVRFVGSLCSLGVYVAIFYFLQKGIARFTKVTLR